MGKSNGKMLGGWGAFWIVIYLGNARKKKGKKRKDQEAL